MPFLYILSVLTTLPSWTPQEICFNKYVKISILTQWSEGHCHPNTSTQHIHGVTEASADHPCSSSNANGCLKKTKTFVYSFILVVETVSLHQLWKKALMLSKHKMQTLVSTSVLISTNSEYSGVIRHGFTLGRHCWNSHCGENIENFYWIIYTWYFFTLRRHSGWMLGFLFTIYNRQSTFIHRLYLFNLTITRRVTVY